MRRIPAIAIVALAALLSAAATTVGPVIGAERATPIPDLTGAWARTTFALEPPVSGPGPLFNPSRQRRNVVPAYTNPILTPEGAKVVRERYESTQAGKPYGTPSSTCWPSVAPMIYRVQEMALLQQKDQVTIVYMQDHEVRRVRMNAEHPARVTPTWHGDSIGHYEGDTLVIDTIGAIVGPVNVIDGAGSPYSDALHVIERYRLVDFEVAKEARDRNVRVNGPPGTNQAAAIDPDYMGKGLQVEFRVEDPKIFKTPWSGIATYSKADALWTENVCAENTFEYYNNRDTLLPVAARPDF